MKYCADCGHLSEFHTAQAGCRGDGTWPGVRSYLSNGRRICQCGHAEVDVEETTVGKPQLGDVAAAYVLEKRAALQRMVDAESDSAQEHGNGWELDRASQPQPPGAVLDPDSVVVKPQGGFIAGNHGEDVIPVQLGPRETVLTAQQVRALRHRQRARDTGLSAEANRQLGEDVPPAATT